jgi:hypothetical protein
MLESKIDVARLPTCLLLALSSATFGCGEESEPGTASPAAGASSTGGNAGGVNNTMDGGNVASGGASAGATNGGAVATGGASGGTTSNAGGGGSAGTAGSGAVAPAACGMQVKAGLPATAPKLTSGEWTDITPASHVAYKGTNESMIAQGIALDPCQPTTLYWCTTPFDPSKGGLFKSTDAGGTWKRIGRVTPDNTGADQLDEPLHVRIDPKDSQHLYVGDGVRGGTTGFWVSYDGGETFAKPPGWLSLEATKTMTIGDVYDVAVDPTDFAHVLVSFHGSWGWTDTKWNTSSGVLETKDGGDTFIVHEPGAWGTGHAIHFLYDPAHGVGDANTWLLGTQGGGYYRTGNAGGSWTKVVEGGIFHGGGTAFYSKSGVLYASGYPSSRRSTDNGLTWQPVGPSGGGTTCLFGDGQTLWTAPALGDNSYSTSPESDGETWALYAGGAQKWHNGGPFEMTLDPVNRVLYASNWEQGAMALKLP